MPVAPTCSRSAGVSFSSLVRLPSISRRSNRSCAHGGVHSPFRSASRKWTATGSVARLGIPDSLEQNDGAAGLTKKLFFLVRENKSWGVTFDSGRHYFCAGTETRATVSARTRRPAFPNRGTPATCHSNRARRRRAAPTGHAGDVPLQPAPPARRSVRQQCDVGGVAE